MKRAWIGLVLGLAWACGGSSNSGGGSGTKNLANFQGATWSGTGNQVTTCSGQPPANSSGSVSFALSAGSGADLQYSSTAGCLFKFNVSGNTASLANAPVTCSTVSGGVTVTITITSYTLTTSDGHNLSFSNGGTASASGTTCTIAITGTVTR